MKIQRTLSVDGRTNLSIEGLFTDDYEALLALLSKSGSPQFEALAASVKEQEKPYVVEIQRTHPYVESVYSEHDDLIEAKRYAKESAKLHGVAQALIWDENEEVIETYCGEVD